MRLLPLHIYLAVHCKNEKRAQMKTWKKKKEKKGGGKKTLGSVSHLAEIKNSSLRLVRRYLGWFAKLSMQIARWLVVVLGWWNSEGVRTLCPPQSNYSSMGWRPVCTTMSLSRKRTALPLTHMWICWGRVEELHDYHFCVFRPVCAHDILFHSRFNEE